MATLLGSASADERRVLAQTAEALYADPHVRCSGREGGEALFLLPIAWAEAASVFPGHSQPGSLPNKSPSGILNGVSFQVFDCL